MMTAQRKKPAGTRAARAAARDRRARGMVFAARCLASKAAAAASSALRALRRGFARSAMCVALPPRARDAPAEEGKTAQQPADADSVPSRRIHFVLRLMPPAELAAAAALPFDFRGRPYAMNSAGGLYVSSAASTTAASLLDLCAAWLKAPAECITIRGARRTLSAAAPRRTVAQAGLTQRSVLRWVARRVAASGAQPVADAPPEHLVPPLRVTVLPLCCICLEPVARGRVWSCASRPAHTACQACAKRFAQTAVTLRPSLAMSWLRCPAPGCATHLAAGAALHRLISFKDLDRMRAERAARHAERLGSARAGHEVRAREPASMRACLA